MSRIAALLSEAASRLDEAGVEGAGRDARRLLAHVLDVDTGTVPALEDGLLTPEAVARFHDGVARRAAREPLSHITGERDFWRHRFIVTPDVLDPRPETETLVELALSEPFERVLDLGTGSGCILISLLAARPEATGVGCDISPEAVLVAGANAERMGVVRRLVLPLSDWFDDVGGRFDLIVSNPPYIAGDEMAGLAPEVRDHEPRAALTDEADGLSAYRRIAAAAPDHLRPGGRLLLEVGPDQSGPVADLLRGAGLAGVAIHPDLDGRARVVSARAAFP